MESIESEGHPAVEIFQDLHALFLKANRATQPIDVNKIVFGVLQLLNIVLKDHGIEVRTDFSPKLPLVDGQSSQLEEVVSERLGILDVSPPHFHLWVRLWVGGTMPRKDADLRANFQACGGGRGTGIQRSPL